MKAEVINFQVRSGTGTQTVNLSDSGLTPSLIILAGTADATVDAFTTSQAYQFGAWDGTRNVSVCCVSLNGQGTSDAFRNTDGDHCVTLRVSEGGGLTSSATVDSVAAGSFTLDWDNNDTVQRRMVAYVFELDDQYCNFITIPTTATSQAYSSFGFQPDAVIGSGVALTAAQDDSAIAHLLFSLGWSDGTSTGCVGTGSEDGQGTTDTYRIIDDSALYNLPFNNAAFIRATLTSLDSDGMTLNFSDVPGTSERLIVIAFGGVTAEVDATFDYPTGTGNDTISSTITTPKFAIEACTRQTSVDTLQAGSNLMFGAYDGSVQAAIWGGDEDNQGTSDSDRYFDTGAMVLVADHAQAIDGEAAANQLSSGVRRNFSNALASAYKGTAFFLGDAATATQVGPLVNGGLVNSGLVNAGLVN